MAEWQLFVVVPHEHCRQQHHDSNSDTAIRYVKNREQAHLDEIRDDAIHETILNIRQPPAHNEPECRFFQTGMDGTVCHPDDGDEGGQNGEHLKERSKPDPEGDAGVEGELESRKGAEDGNTGDEERFRQRGRKRAYDEACRSCQPENAHGKSIAEEKPSSGGNNQISSIKQRRKSDRKIGGLNLETCL